MERTISAEVGKGSVAHNSRKFHAKNTDRERSHLNRCYCSEDIKAVYKELFGEALEKYNAKQTRSDRKISNYYEKIRSGKQEKLFHELILQIGNCNDTNAQSEFGAEVAEMLDEYMRGFQERNPHLRVFAAYLHMDEATPHLHIDFIPFTTGSKRGLETRVSLKSALAQQGIVGGTKLETEWNLFVSREKEQLAKIMQSHGIEWRKLGTHEKHLSVLDYEKKMRSLEVAELTERVDFLKDSKEELEEELFEAERKHRELNEEIEELKTMSNEVEMEVHKYFNDPEWRLPEPKALTGVKSYKEKIATPLITRLKNVIASLVSRLKDFMRNYNRKLEELQWERSRCKKLELQNKLLQRDSDTLQTIRDELGDDAVEEILDRAQQRMEAEEALYEQEHALQNEGFSMKF
ncbi:MAG: plasmid recombination protein [Clostridia bacterium]|nr:plasmid recombination protein [Clostridia bacterium]